MILCRFRADRATWTSALLLALSLLPSGCSKGRSDSRPAVEFTRVPRAAPGGTETLDTIEGRVRGARAGQRIVLFARSGAWWVQPRVDRPFTTVGTDARWGNVTHLGTEYAAMLVEPGYEPPARTETLPDPGGAVVALAVSMGEPVFWQTWWFRLLGVLTILSSALVFYRFRLHQLTQELNVRFEERLAERTRMAQELHDTLLQGFLSVSMHIDVAGERLPPDSPAKPMLDRANQLITQVVEEGRNVVRGLRSEGGVADDLEQAFSRIEGELARPEGASLRVLVEGRPRPVPPAIRDEVYRIGREALVNAFRHSGATRIEVELEYAADRLRVLVRDDGRGIDPELLRSGREGHWGLSGMRERAERMGARLKVWSGAGVGTEVELSIRSQVAYPGPLSSRLPGFWARFSRRGKEAKLRPESERTQ